MDAANCVRDWLDAGGVGWALAGGREEEAEAEAEEGAAEEVEEDAEANAAEIAAEWRKEGVRRWVVMGAEGAYT